MIQILLHNKKCHRQFDMSSPLTEVDDVIFILLMYFIVSVVLCAIA